MSKPGPERDTTLTPQTIEMPDDEFRPLPDKVDGSYAPNYDFQGEYINDTHRDPLSPVDDVPGWMWPEDAQKLYELAYFSRGSILEIGTWRGRSTAIMAGALRDAGRDAPSIVSLDIDATALSLADEQLKQRGLRSHVQLIRGSAQAYFKAQPDFRPTLTFVDGAHTLKGVQRDIRALAGHIPAGGLLFFHDYVDKRYGIAEGVTTSWINDQCQFAGRFGCAALYCYGDPGNVNGAGGQSFTDLIGLETLAMQIRSRVLIPATELLRIRQMRDRLRKDASH